ncbi:MAG: protein kinase [Catenulispora sp.]|nr:protein kinase [Catenulispora sp.]
MSDRGDSTLTTYYPLQAREYVPGPTLQEAVEKGGPFASPWLRALASAIADALMTMHAAGVVHRDLKPATVLLGPNGPQLTNTGQAAALSTSAYISPEQADGRPVQSASDVFALGALLVFAATGRPPFGDGAPLAVLQRVVNDVPDLTGVSEDDPELRWLIQQCLAKEPNDRPSAARLREVLGEVLGAVPWGPPAGVNAMAYSSYPSYPPTRATGPKGKRGKRIAVISAATAAALATAAIAVAVTQGTGKDQTAAKGSTRVGDPLAGVDPGSGAFPGSGIHAGNGSSGGPSPDGNNPAASSGSPASPPGTAAPDPSASTSHGQPSSSKPSHSTVAPTTSKTSAAKPTSKPTSPPRSTTPPPAHKPPAPLAAGEVKVDIPTWYLMATIDVSWNARPDATGYIVHFTESDGDDENISIPDPWYSYQVRKGVTTCVQVKAVNQYGESAFSPMYCVDPASHESH